MRQLFYDLQNRGWKKVSLCCSHIIFGAFLSETFFVFKNFPYISTPEWITRALYYLCVLVTLALSNVVFHRRCKGEFINIKPLCLHLSQQLSTFIIFVVFTAADLLLFSIRAVLFHRWWLEGSREESVNPVIALSEDIAMCCFCSVHLLLLIASVFVIFEWHNINMDRISEQTLHKLKITDIDLEIAHAKGTHLVRHTFGFINLLYVIDIIIWILESAGNPNPLSIFLASIFTFSFVLGWVHLAIRDVHTILWRITTVTAAVLIHLQAIEDIGSPILGA
ncbi:Oidioi.mRNA.OKI2018_I69.chr2.g4701.t1.cds [Oikopleura dioica]|uniref:Oidioi.mRNA.OKI2018_I69.chr2.g4701.t1.cds n=1 Tax=Oikopleura dioica TaxID=34765 RepID=A0ABN7T4Q9_OIKDI|nr:Oidioi.mRNA.OKI2018_I69.chr2.g4701.t1.cds [Oikopleura dioica]